MDKWILAIRVKTLPAAIAPVLVGSALSYKDSFFDIFIFFMTLLAALLIQIGTNFANDVFDFQKGTDRDDRLGPTRATQAGLITPENMKKAMWKAFSMSIFVGLYLAFIGGWPIVIIGLASIIAGIAYTGGPYPLGYNGFGELFVFLFFGIIAVPGSFYLQSGTVNADSIYLGASMGMISSAILVVNNLRDINTDKVTGKKTLAVSFGVIFSYFEYFILILGPYIIHLYLIINNSYKLSMFIVFFSLPIALHLFFQLIIKKGSELNNVLASTSRLLVLFALLTSFGLIL